MFRKILIANRGEIAVRIIRACREMGISPIAIYSDADRTALHVRMADEAVYVGGAPSIESYLKIDRVIDAAQKSRADAIHPGYGFLSENPEFARMVSSAGITFIGPSAEAMEQMGSKTSARSVAIAAGVPVVPGSIAPLTSLDDARETAKRFGYPVMLKASAGGGGKGMRLVEQEADLASSFENACSEAAAAFGNSDVYIEKAIRRPRHIEIQIFSDSHGNFVHLGERECSIQRRHQKVIEECPSPINDPELRERMGRAAIKAAQAVDYTGAGTVEFLVDDTNREFYFLEMNTRLQVEHPVTELVTGIDLVKEQINVAAGMPLSFRQDDVTWRGHAIECRVYAEDPLNNFLPSPGNISFLRSPSGPGVRDDSGVFEGTDVSIYYDPMISKLAAWGRTRSEAIERLRRALDEYEVGGIKTTLPFFRSIVRDEEFIAGHLDTNFINSFFQRSGWNTSHLNNDERTEDEVVLQDIAVIAAALDYRRKQQARSASTNKNETTSSNWKIAGRTGFVR